MSEVLTAAQMRAIEAAAIASGAVTGLELMERAGAGVVAAVLEEWPELALTPQRAVVLCGPGNNGGDGFVVARLLAGRGWAVEVYLYGDAGKLPPDARVNYERWLEVGEVKDLELASVVQALFANATQETNFETGAPLVVDALFGTGLGRAITGDLDKIVGLLSDMKEFSHGAVVAVDIASGLCADSGRVLGRGVSAALTVTFHKPKRGHFLQDGQTLSGKLTTVDIGLRNEVGDVVLCDLQSDRLPKGSQSHKFSHGHALIVSGDHGHAGAARMAARAALRIGAGLVTVASPRGAMAENAARLDAVMLKPVADAAGLAEVLADVRINALCLGPGMGLDEAAAELVKVALETSRLRVKLGAAQGLRLVLDADALTLISRDARLFALLHEGCVLTPHTGEFARLFPDIAAKLAAPAVKGPAYSKVDATREAAARAGCVVLYKGADTVIAAPDGRCSINAAVYDRAAPWLATAGSGDVLAGFITGLLARGFQPMLAAETAAWLHVECARSFGPGLIADDLPEELPKVLRALGV
jgi:hydroxyethylthiazole kinase-like uncharacterized protein yjeF